MNNMNEDSLVKKCVQGSRKAQKELFDRYTPKMLAVATRYIGDQERAEDVLQDSFVKVFKHLANFKLVGSLEGWIRKVVVNTALDQLRKEKKYKSDIELDSVNFEIGQSSDAEEMMQADFLLGLVKQLPEGYRTVFNLFAIEGYSHKEIADLLNVSENTSKSQYSRARGALVKALEKYNVER